MVQAVKKVIEEQESVRAIREAVAQIGGGWINKLMEQLITLPGAEEIPIIEWDI